MNTYKTTACLVPTEAAYIAGLIDGEGTITLTRKHRDENRQQFCADFVGWITYLHRFFAAGRAPRIGTVFSGTALWKKLKFLFSAELVKPIDIFRFFYMGHRWCWS